MAEFEASEKIDVTYALKYVMEEGDEFDRYRIKVLFEKYRDIDDAVKYLEERESPDGGFFYRLQKGNPVSICESARMLKLMIEVDLFKTPVFQRTKNFLLGAQSDEFFWDENPELKEFETHRYDVPGELSTRTWLTGEIIRLIARDDEHENPKLKKGCRYLLDQFGQYEIAGFDVANFVTLASMAWTHTEDFKITSELSDTTGEIVSREKDMHLMGWYMDCMIESSHMEGVFICLRNLQMGLNVEGLWESAEFPDRKVDTQIVALRQCRWGKRW